jgi:hypothetical protein
MRAESKAGRKGSESVYLLCDQCRVKIRLEGKQESL